MSTNSSTTSTTGAVAPLGVLLLPDEQRHFSSNYPTVDNKEHSHPFATVTKASMEQVVLKLYMGYRDGSGQIPAMKEGEEALLEKFPHMSKITTCRVVEAFSSSGVSHDA